MTGAKVGVETGTRTSTGITTSTGMGAKVGVGTGSRIAMGVAGRERETYKMGKEVNRKTREGR